MNYVINNNVPEIGDKGFIVGDRLIVNQKVKVKISEEGLVFYALLTEWTGRAETGQTLTAPSGSIFVSTYGKNTGIEIKPRSQYGSHTYIGFGSIDNFPVNHDVFTISMQFVYAVSGTCVLLNYGPNDGHNGIRLIIIDGKIGLGDGINELNNSLISG